jgi:NAD(P)H-dependent flavin oxidoreductase YrpB (nitropropane dioxygenase family)
MKTRIAELFGIERPIVPGGKHFVGLATDAGAWSCGVVVGLINDIPTVAELLDRIAAEADAIVTNRLASFNR